VLCSGGYISRMRDPSSLAWARKYP
jgi:hypothetical protein